LLEVILGFIAIVFGCLLGYCFLIVLRLLMRRQRGQMTKKQKEAERMRRWRANKRAEDEEAYLNIQRDYRARKRQQQ
jgi:hypothetical protein